MNFNEKYESYKLTVENGIRNFIENLNCHEQLKASMSYSLLAGGKRVRPVMFLACLETLGVDFTNYINLAVAIECVHTYSLIHDDLPALDNDDFRRGRPSNHKVFGEGFAVLAGDALLNSAFELALDSVDSKGSLEAVKYLMNCAGAFGMINGQAYDLYYEDKTVDDKENLLFTIHEFKTGKLLTAPLVMASLIANGKYLDELTKIGHLTGKLFQFSDDLLDITGTFEDMGKTLGKDDYAGKLTAVSVYGKEGTISHIEKMYSDIVKILKNIDNNLFFVEFYDYIKNRKN